MLDYFNYVRAPEMKHFFYKVTQCSLRNAFNLKYLVNNGNLLLYNDIMKQIQQQENKCGNIAVYAIFQIDKK